MCHPTPSSLSRTPGDNDVPGHCPCPPSLHILSPPPSFPTIPTSCCFHSVAMWQQWPLDGVCSACGQHGDVASSLGVIWGVVEVTWHHWHCWRPVTWRCWGPVTWHLGGVVTHCRGCRQGLVTWRHWVASLSMSWRCRCRQRCRRACPSLAQMQAVTRALNGSGGSHARWWWGVVVVVVVGRDGERHNV